MILFVDDLVGRFDRFMATHPNAEAVHALTPWEACERVVMLGLGEGDEVWLDHDAGFFTRDWKGEICCHIPEITFRPVAHLLAAMHFTGTVHLHSGNSVGREWMLKLLQAHDVKVIEHSGGLEADRNGDSVWDYENRGN